MPLPLRHQQLRALFEVYDADRDGRISRGEMLAHVTAVLTLAAAMRSQTAQTAVSPAALAKATVDTCFAGADEVCCGSVYSHGGPCFCWLTLLMLQDNSGFLTFPQFRDWLLASD